MFPITAEFARLALPSVSFVEVDTVVVAPSSPVPAAVVDDVTPDTEMSSVAWEDAHAPRESTEPNLHSVQSKLEGPEQPLHPVSHALHWATEAAKYWSAVQSDADTPTTASLRRQIPSLTSVPSSAPPSHIVCVVSVPSAAVKVKEDDEVSVPQLLSLSQQMRAWQVE
eukprot:CAMPEP_0204336448 /NCGR_PEP_ID=MMETSP0469-20131031/19544_1 /ASSEMBLY_ACC=CAM_ASM_000384 /TAXON_ID=2969 /ORGANISM="Oxyrrhis marina" /LENGTH=167 /DNA_ID=CAMNT_0051320321 /DNA_START=102 /DNA_END=605 /DNA_ORIENTATION=-